MNLVQCVRGTPASQNIGGKPTGPISGIASTVHTLGEFTLECVIAVEHDSSQDVSSNSLGLRHQFRYGGLHW